MKEVGLVAKGDGWELAPPDMELWGVNDSIARDENIDLCFFMDRELLDKHDFTTKKGREDFQKAVGLPPDSVENIRNTIQRVCNERNLPVYCTKVFPDLPTSMEYPIDDIVSYFGTDYFGNSLDYMIALAIYQGYEAIHTYGLNMSQGSKYIYEKPSTTFWLGVALGRGIELYLEGDECQLLSTMNGKMYAYQEVQYRSQGLIKIDPGRKPMEIPDTQTVSLSALERMLLLHYLPTKARYQVIRAIEEFKRNISFSFDEEKALALHTDGTGTTVKFVEDGLPEKPYEISRTMVKVIKKTMLHLDQQGKIDTQLARLYERFVLGE